MDVATPWTDCQNEADAMAVQYEKSTDRLFASRLNSCFRFRIIQTRSGDSIPEDPGKTAGLAP